MIQQCRSSWDLAFLTDSAPSKPFFGVPKTKNQRSSVRQSRDTMDTNRDTMDTNRRNVARQNTLLGTSCHRTPDKERGPTILDSFTQLVPHTAHSPLHEPKHQTLEDILIRTNTLTDDGEFPSFAFTTEESCINNNTCKQQITVPSRYQSPKSS